MLRSPVLKLLALAGLLILLLIPLLQVRMLVEERRERARERHHKKGLPAKVCTGCIARCGFPQE